MESCQKIFPLANLHQHLQEEHEISSFSANRKGTASVTVIHAEKNGPAFQPGSDFSAHIGFFLVTFNEDVFLVRFKAASTTMLVYTIQILGQKESADR